jgi:hypothetical protein
MKKQAYTMIATIVLVGSMAVAAQAQSSGTQWIANIPFEFSAGDKTLPAGEYTVRQTNPHSDVAALQIRRRDGSVSAMVLAVSVIGREPESPKLIFRRYGNQYFFAQAWVDGDNTGLHAPKSRVERKAGRELAGNKVKTETVAIRNR